jgi:hypothetical protein
MNLENFWYSKPMTVGEISRIRLILSLALLPGTRLRAIKLAAVVGTILFLINQWEACLGDAPVQWAKAVLTYCVPYLVSTYTSVMKDYETIVRTR